MRFQHPASRLSSTRGRIHATDFRTVQIYFREQWAEENGLAFWSVRKFPLATRRYSGSCVQSRLGLFHVHLPVPLCASSESLSSLFSTRHSRSITSVLRPFERSTAAFLSATHALIMRCSTFVALSVAGAAPAVLSQYLPQPPPIEYTQVQEINQTTRTGQLSYGASNLDFGYSAGAGINFGNGLVGGGFNAGIPGKENGGSLGGGWTVTARNITFGLGAAFNNMTVDVAIVADKVTGYLSVKVNGKETMESFRETPIGRRAHAAPDDSRMESSRDLWFAAQASLRDACPGSIGRESRLAELGMASPSCEPHISIFRSCSHPVLIFVMSFQGAAIYARVRSMPNHSAGMLRPCPRFCPGHPCTAKFRIPAMSWRFSENQMVIDHKVSLIRQAAMSATDCTSRYGRAKSLLSWISWRIQLTKRLISLHPQQSGRGVFVVGNSVAMVLECIKKYPELKKKTAWLPSELLVKTGNSDGDVPWGKVT
ncbi:hypothetical protein JHW43_009369 [Diplocarpon mali]|nr:hypothetical protein JHW43_009369 [Diplocarpon mali]